MISRRGTKASNIGVAQKDAIAVDANNLPNRLHYLDVKSLWAKLKLYYGVHPLRAVRNLGMREFSIALCERPNAKCQDKNQTGQGHPDRTVP